MKKRFLCLICAVFFVLQSCVNPAEVGDNTRLTENVQQNVADTTEKTDTNVSQSNAFSDIPSEDFGGREFVILTTDEAFCDSAEKSGIIGSELYKRNRAIEQKFNIKIRAVPVKDSALQSSLSGGGYDLVYAPMNTLASCAGNGYTMNIYSVPFFDYGAEYVNPSLLASLTQSDTLYAVFGDAAYDTRYMWAVYYNKDIATQLGYGNINELVLNGEWTWEKFLEFSSAALLDVDKNGRMRAANDRYGYASTYHTTDFADAVFASIGKKFFTHNGEGNFEMSFAETDEDKYISFIRDICVKNKARYPQDNPGNASYDAFCEGRLLFLCEKLSYASKLAYAPCNWGVLPMPKKNAEQQSYLSLVDKTACGYAVPFSATDTALCGKVLSAIYAYNYSYGTDVVRDAWTYYYLRDNTSSVNISKISQSPVYDAAYVFGDTFADFRMTSYEILHSAIGKNANFTHLYNQNKKPFSDFIKSRFTH